ncbi:MAG: antitoxin [Alphaproteobacteria bacterium]|nr:antitoxin [Alphaproteobacteria bacterium]
MPLYIRSEEADQLARELAARTGLNITDAVTMALRAELSRTPPKPQTLEEKLAFIRQLQEESARRPVLDPRAPDELLYDQDGLPR